MHIVKSVRMEIAVDGLRRHAAHAEHRGKSVRTQPKVRDGAQEVERSALLLNGIVSGTLAQERDGLRVEFRPLSLERPDNDARRRDGCAALGAFRIERELFLVHHHLQTGKTGSVRELQKGDRRRVARGAHPAAHGDLAPEERLVL